MKLAASVTLKRTDDLYKIVDLLNRTLKRDDLMFGLALDRDDSQKMVFTIYRTRV
ncbi:MAG: YpmA family protein [Tuberibacillus sp.]